MEDYPGTLLEFEERFGTDEACREYLFQLRWPDGFVCPRCGHEKAWATRRGLYHCAGCGHQGSVTAGTIFESTRKPLRLWFRAMWHVTTQKNGASALGLQRVLGLGSYETAWTWLHKLRWAMVRPGRDRLAGVVEVDEAFIGGQQPGKRGRAAAGKALVVVMAQEEGNRIGRVRLKRVADGSAHSLIGAISGGIEVGSVVRMDGYLGYSPLSEAGYAHQIVRPDDDLGENPLPLVNRVVALLKRWLLGTHQGAVRASHLDYYLDEFTFRFNRRTSRSRGKLCYRLGQQAVAADPFPQHQITGGIQLE